MSSGPLPAWVDCVYEPRVVLRFGLRFIGRFQVTLPPAPDAILTAAEVAALLKIRPRQVQRLGFPCINLGRKTKRYKWADVLRALEERRG